MVKTVLSDKVVSKEKIRLAECKKVINNEEETREVLNAFFSAIIRDINNTEYNSRDPVVNETSNLVLKTVAKYRNYPSTLRIGKVCEKTTFSF